MSQILPETFQRKTYRVNDSDETASLTRFKLSFIHFHKHRFRQNFKDLLNPLCSFSIEAETTNYYFLRYLFYNENRKKSYKCFEKYWGNPLIPPLLYWTFFTDLITVVLNFHFWINIIIIICVSLSFTFSLLDLH